MTGVNLVTAVSHDQHGARARDAPPEILHQVERGVVRPVHVLDDEDEGLPGTLELIDHGGEDALAVRALGHGVEQCTACLAAHVAQWPERLRRRERIARAPQYADRRAAAPDELTDDRRLADARFAGHERDAPAAGRSGILPARQQRQLFVPLEKQHQ